MNTPRNLVLTLFALNACGGSSASPRVADDRGLVADAAGAPTSDAAPSPDAVAPSPDAAPQSPDAASPTSGITFALPPCPSARWPVQRAPDGTPPPAEVAAAVEAVVGEATAALASMDVARVDTAICALRTALSDWQGVAEVETPRLDAPAVLPDRAEASEVFLRRLTREIVGREAWARVGGAVDGLSQMEPLRGACNTVVWYLRAATLPGADAQTLRAQALEGLEWLLRVQRPEGLFPYPDLSADAEAWLEACAESGRDAATCRDALPRALELGALGRARWETAGRPEGVYVDGWIVDTAPLGDPGGLQFDTGICGLALVEGFVAFSRPDLLAAARRAGDWARRQTPVLNFNYNAFSVGLLAALHAHDPEAAQARWLDAAATKARIGVLPGMLPDGLWLDPHNARPVYHNIIVAELMRLRTQLADVELAALVDTALSRITRDAAEVGVAGIEDGLVALVQAERLGLPVDDALARYVAAAWRGGNISNAALVEWLAR